MFAILFFSGPPEPVEPPECLSARLGSLASAERGQAGGGEEQGKDDYDDD